MNYGLRFSTVLRRRVMHVRIQSKAECASGSSIRTIGRDSIRRLPFMRTESPCRPTYLSDPVSIIDRALVMARRAMRQDAIEWKVLMRISARPEWIAHHLSRAIEARGVVRILEGERQRLLKEELGW